MTTISFERKNGKIYHSFTGEELDIALLSTFPVDYALDYMSGRIYLPTGFVVAEDGTPGDVKLIGTKVFKPTQNDPTFSGEPTNVRDQPVYTGRTSLEIEPGENTDFNAEKLEDLEHLTHDDVFQEGGLDLDRVREVVPHMKMVETFTLLGLVPRPEKSGMICRWYHPAFGDDKRENHLLFDPETDSLDTLLPKIFRLGARLGTNALKMLIKATLEQHYS
jgi:hypothetical protein